jgi:hypothetical protein
MTQTKIVTKLTLFLLLALTPFFFSSCSDDDDDKASNNEISLGSETYKAALASITGTEADGKGEYTILITNSTNDPQKAFTVMLNVSFPLKNGVSGSYNNGLPGSYSIDDEDYELHSIASGYFYISVDEGQIQEMDSYYDLTDGICSIKHNKSDNFTITFDIKPADGERVKGSYTGIVMGSPIDF